MTTTTIIDGEKTLIVNQSTDVDEVRRVRALCETVRGADQEDFFEVSGYFDGAKNRVKISVVETDYGAETQSFILVSTETALAAFENALELVKRLQAQNEYKD